MAQFAAGWSLIPTFDLESGCSARIHRHQAISVGALSCRRAGHASVLTRQDVLTEAGVVETNCGRPLKIRSLGQSDAAASYQFTSTTGQLEVAHLSL